MFRRAVVTHWCISSSFFSCPSPLQKIQQSSKCKQTTESSVETHWPLLCSLRLTANLVHAFQRWILGWITTLDLVLMNSRINWYNQRYIVTCENHQQTNSLQWCFAGFQTFSMVLLVTEEHNPSDDFLCRSFCRFLSLWLYNGHKNVKESDLILTTLT